MRGVGRDEAWPWVGARGRTQLADISTGRGVNPIEYVRPVNGNRDPAMAMVRLATLLTLAAVFDGGSEIEPSALARFAPLKNEQAKTVHGGGARCLVAAWKTIEADFANADTTTNATLDDRRIEVKARGALCMITVAPADPSLTGGGTYYFLESGKLVGRFHGK